MPAAFALAFLGAGLDSVIMAQEAALSLLPRGGRRQLRLDFNLKAAITPQLIGALVALGCARAHSGRRETRFARGAPASSSS